MNSTPKTTIESDDVSRLESEGGGGTTVQHVSTVDSHPGNSVVHKTGPGDRTVGHLMTPVVHAVTAQTSLSEIADLMARAGQAQVPVVGPDNELLGILLREDVVPSGPRAHEANTPALGHAVRPWAETKAHHVMKELPFIVQAHSQASEAKRAMDGEKLECSPVVDAGGHLVGMISIGVLG